MTARPGRFLIVVPPLAGHTNPTVGLAAALEARGHRVAWAGYPSFLAPLLPAGAEVHPLGGDIPGAMADEVRERSRGLRGAAALEFLWGTVLVPLAEAMVGPLEAVVDQARPDVLVVDQQAFAGGIVARRRGLPWATSATTSAELSDPFAALPKVGEWVADQLAALAGDGGGTDLRFSEHLTVAYTTAALAGEPVLPAGAGPVVMVGPSLDRPPGAGAAPDPGLARWLAGPGPKVFVTLGTVNGADGGRFFAAALQALGERPGLVVAPDGVVAPADGPVLVRPFVPQLEVLAAADAVVCHAGHNTVCEALAQGLPLVVAPIRDDQPVVADQVVRAGAGVRVRFGRANPAEIGRALTACLDDPALARGARAVQASFAAAGGAALAAARLEELLG